MGGRFFFYKMSKLVIFILGVLLGCAWSVEVEFEQCPNVNTDACTIHSVNIVPCSIYPCSFKKGKTDAKITFDYTPNFDIAAPNTGIYWVNGMDAKKEPKFTDLDGNACPLTSCPLVAGQRNTLNYTLHIGKKLPSGTFKIKWRLYKDESNEDPTQCCFMTSIKLKK